MSAADETSGPRRSRRGLRPQDGDGRGLPQPEAEQPVAAAELGLQAADQGDNLTLQYLQLRDRLLQGIDRDFKVKTADRRSQLVLGYLDISFSDKKIPPLQVWTPF